MDSTTAGLLVAAIVGFIMGMTVGICFSGSGGTGVKKSDNQPRDPMGRFTKK